MNKHQNFRFIGIFSLISIAVLSRFFPHPPNMTAIVALILFSAAELRPRWVSLVLPMVVLLFTDFVLGFHSLMPVLYIAWFVVALVAGGWLKNFTWNRLAYTAVGSSLWFFLVSNLGVWMQGEMYPRTATGLGACYVAALPFLGNQILGDLIYSGALFGVWHFVQARLPILQQQMKSPKS